MTHTLRLAGAALNQTPLDWKGNTERIIAAIQQAKLQQIDLLCLPELALTGYGCEDVFLHSWFVEKAATQIATILPYCENITVNIGVPIRYKNATYNCVAVVQNQQIIGITAKQFLANDGVHYETRWFTPWQSGKSVNITFLGRSIPFGDILYEVKDVKFGIEICEDAWKGKQRPAYQHIKNGAKLILCPSASHFTFGKRAVRHELSVTDSEQLGCAYIYTNLLGNEAGKMVYDGDVIIAQNGRLIQQNQRFSFQDVSMAFAEINFEQPELTATLTKKELDSNEKNELFPKVVSLALFDYMRKTHSKGFVLSLSGGADSTTCAVLVAEMVKRGIAELGIAAFLQKTKCFDEKNTQQIISLPEAQQQYAAVMQQLLTTAYQATGNSSFHTLQSARELAKELSATFYHWNIDDEVNSYTEKIQRAIQRKLSWEKDDIALQNIQARSRSPIIWLLTNVKGALLLTTSNRSEGDVGYTTMDGDTSGGLAPIAGIDKDFIRQWLFWAEQHLGYKSLRFVNQLAPSAELRPAFQTQTDEKDLMPYKVLKEIEVRAIYQRLSPQNVLQELIQEYAEIAPTQLKEYVEKFYRMWSRNQWKRERLAPSFHLDEFSVDPRSWCRFPILSAGFEDELKALKV